jgi:thermitase
MKMKSAYILGFIFLSISSWATPFNGYIIKSKKGIESFQKRSLLSVGKITNIQKTTFGSFALLNPYKNIADQKIENLTKDSEIDYIEPNYIISIQAVKPTLPIPFQSPSDKNFKKQWGLNNDGRNGSILTSGLAGEDINALRAWNITKGSKTIKIAIIDSGIEYTHPDLKEQIDINQAELNGQEGVDDDNNGFIDDIYGYNFAYKNGNPMDGYGHGTQCAGIIGASHNAQGITGVMSDVKLIPVKFLSNNGSGELIDAIYSIDYALRRGANILSNSWGVGARSQALSDAIKAALDKKVTFVTAAGNFSSDNDKVDSIPGNYEIENVISTGAFSSKGKLSYFSNFGAKTVHVMAPGEEIFTTYLEGQYYPESGTSMAAPFVSGIVGLLLSKEPNLSPLEIRDRLIRTSTKTPNLSQSSISAGRVNAYRALMNITN